jgi:MurNAc alpha-1-phosphate uridylyltransferase
MVFAAGLGTRMQPVTATTPKPLIDVGGKPLIDHMLDRLDEAGVEQAIVNLHYMADRIETHCERRRKPRIVFSDERDLLLDQAGGLRKALPLLGDEPLFICNTDALWLEGPDSNLKALAAHWDPAIMDIQLLVAATTASAGVDWRGDFFMGPDGQLSRRAERDVAPFVYTGAGIVKPSLFKGGPAGPDPLAPYFFAAAARGRLYGKRLDGFWLHVGTPSAIAEAEDRIKRSVY